MSKTLMLLLSLLFALSLNAQSTYKKNITVKPSMELQNYEHFKRLVLIADDPQVEYLDDFNFEWGFEYKLKVEVTKLTPELSDGTRYEYKRVKEVSKKKVADSTEFKLFIDPLVYYGRQMDEEGLVNESLIAVNDSTFLYFDEVEIEVPKALLEKFNKVRNSEHGKRGHFTYVNKKRIRLVKI